MNKLKQTAAGTVLGASSYTSPAVKVTEILSEGVLCMSINMFLKDNSASFEEWNDEKDLNW